MEKFISVIPKLTTQDIFSKHFPALLKKRNIKFHFCHLKKLTRKYTGWQQIQKCTAARGQKEFNAILTGT